MFDYAQPDISGLTHAALSMRPFGMTRRIRKAIGDVLWEKVRYNIHRGAGPPSPHTAAARINNAMLDLLLVPLDFKRPCTKRLKAFVDARVVLGTWTHTDMRQPDIHVYVDHAVTDKQVETTFRVNVAHALFPRAWSTWNRSRWKGDGDTARQAALVYAYHGVGQVAFERVLKTTDDTVPKAISNVVPEQACIADAQVDDVGYNLSEDDAKIPPE